MQADIDRRVAGLAPSGQTFPAPADFMPRPLAVGQWAQYKMVDDNGRPSFMTQKIVGEDAGAFWFETTHESYTGRTIVKMLVAFGNRMDPSTFDIRALTMRDRNGHVNAIQPQVLAFMKSMYANALSMLAVSWQGQPQEDATVPAGTFAGCFKAQTSASWGPWHAASTSWSHAAVPISGLVRSQGLDHPTKMELVAFGDTGATSELP